MKHLIQLIFGALLLAIVGIGSTQCNVIHMGGSRIQIDTIPLKTIDSMYLGDGGGCMYTDKENPGKKENYILVTQMDSSVHRAIVCINNNVTVLKFDSVYHINKNDTTVVFESYKNIDYRLTIETHVEIHDTATSDLMGGIITIKNQSGDIVTTHILGGCGAN